MVLLCRGSLLLPLYGVFFTMYPLSLSAICSSSQHEHLVECGTRDMQQIAAHHVYYRQWFALGNSDNVLFATVLILMKLKPACGMLAPFTREHFDTLGNCCLLIQITNLPKSLLHTPNMASSIP